MIEGVIVKPLEKKSNAHGYNYQMLSSYDKEFKGFGELYFSLAYPNVIKGWHLHHKMILNYAVIIGSIKLVIFDSRKDSKTKGEVMELLLGDNQVSLVQVASLLWTGFKGIGSPYSIVANCSTIPHFENEITRLDPFSTEIPYDWRSHE